MPRRGQSNDKMTIQQIRVIMEEARTAFNSGHSTNHEQELFDFHVSEMTDSDRSCMMYLKPSQVYGVLKLFRKQVNIINRTVIMDCEPFVHNGKVVDEGQVIVTIDWDCPFPGTGPVPTC